MVRLSTPVGVCVPVAAFAAFLRTHACGPSSQLSGTASVRSRLVVGAYGISDCDPLPLIVHCAWLSVDAPEALKTNGVPSFGFATFTIVRKPDPAVTTQSDGSE